MPLTPGTSATARPRWSAIAPGAPLVNSPGVSPCGAAQWEAPCAASAYHSYKYGGTYEVTLTVTDVGGNTASVKEPITVVGPPEPKPEPTDTRAGTHACAYTLHGNAGRPRRLRVLGRLQWNRHRIHIDTAPGARRLGHLQVAEKGAQQRSPGALHDKRAGGRQHRGTARKQPRPSALASKVRRLRVCPPARRSRSSSARPCS